jgi:hypothetical protein
MSLGNFNLTLDMFDGTDHAANQIVFTVTNTSSVLWNTAADVLTKNDPLHNTEVAAHIVVFSGPPVNGAQLATGYVAGNSGGTPTPRSVCGDASKKFQ